MLGSRFHSQSRQLRSDVPLDNAQIMAVAPSVFASAEHDSRSDRYRYISTGVVLEQLRNEGFQPFMAAQTRSRDADRREFTKHMLRLRHADSINSTEAQEVILLNSHDGTSSWQMLSGVFRFVCCNGLVCGDIGIDIRVRHKGTDVADRVIEGAYEVVQGFDRITASRDDMAAITLSRPEAEVFAQSALVAKYGEGHVPLMPEQVLMPRRWEDTGSDLWSVFNRVQENLSRGGLSGHTATGKARTLAPWKVSPPVLL